MSREFQPVQPKPTAFSAPKRPTLTPAAERKKPKSQIVPPHASKDISLIEAGRYGTLNEFAFFDKVSISSIIALRYVMNYEVIHISLVRLEMKMRKE